MMTKPESEFPTVNDLASAIADLIERGLGDLAVQIVVAPDSTMQSLARSLDPNYGGAPAMMIDLTMGIEGRLPIAFISTERLGGRQGMSTVTQ